MAGMVKGHFLNNGMYLDWQQVETFESGVRVPADKNADSFADTKKAAPMDGPSS